MYTYMYWLYLKELYRDSGVVTFNPSDGGSVNYNGDAFAFGGKMPNLYLTDLQIARQHIQLATQNRSVTVHIAGLHV